MAITMVIPDASVMERETEIEGRSTIIGPQFEFFMGGNSSFSLRVMEYWRTVYLVHNNVRHVCVILRGTEVSFAAEQNGSMLAVRLSPREKSPKPSRISPREKSRFSIPISLFCSSTQPKNPNPTRDSSLFTFGIEMSRSRLSINGD
ncbi:hypothetical protein H5410_011916 [Solanum commersonii]|uniref:Uncharacterized protein n=1 Tax=Solanum commersonii TaxID=4109 RepID=A0A9J6AR78_SOLCO|nr:hypothetical protein H5410_011916 [Solanum commersonii]